MKRNVYHQSGRNQKGWQDSSQKPGYQRNQFKEEDYNATLGIFMPLWQYIVQRYQKAKGILESQVPIGIFGYDALPLAIELSQWGYPITYITDSLEGVKKAEQDCKIQAGSFKHFLYYDFMHNAPRVRLIIFIGLIDERLDNQQIYNYLDLLLRRCNEIVCAVSPDKNWHEILNGKYWYTIKKVQKWNYNLLTLREYEPTIS